MTVRVIQSDDPLNDPVVGTVRDLLRAGGLVAVEELAGVDVPNTVAGILADVLARGDDACCEWEKKLDDAELNPHTLRVEPEAISRAHAQADAEFLALIRRTADNIREYQRSIRVADPPPLTRGGRTLSVRYTPIDRVGVYVPGGKALYPSSVLMSVVPAQVAGVGELTLASPPRCDGEIDPTVLALAGELGIEEVYRLGGAVAIAAMAFGTSSIRQVCKIVGPGNAFVAEAKRQVFGRVGIDAIAGPSEVLIVADETADPRWIAADMLAQAEHDPGSAVLVTDSKDLAERVCREVDDQLPSLERVRATRRCLETYSAIIVTGDMDAAFEVANDFATEHLQIITADPQGDLKKIRNAGAIFLGPDTPVPLGDYYAGPSHVLPTGGTAKFFGPLSVNDFRKSSSVIRYDAESLEADADDVIDFATREGLTAHARAVRMRREATD